jgi:deoxyribonuclease V
VPGIAAARRPAQTRAATAVSVASTVSQPFSHTWDVTPAEARAIQREGRAHVVSEDRLGSVTRVAGIDVGFEQQGAISRAAVAILEFPSLRLAESAVVRVPTAFPYVPGLLSFRESPAVLEALGRLSAAPDLLLCDGQGYAHPRRFGLACHIGVLTGLPSIGVAKSRLIGTHGALPERKGAWVPLLDGDETIGAVLRTRSGVAPLFVSIGHRVSLPTAIRWVLACTTRYRLPETTRQAHRLASGPAR